MTNAKYVELKNVEASKKTEKKWYDWCRAKRVPFITIRPRVMFADVKWEHIYGCLDVDAAMAKNTPYMHIRVGDIFARYAGSYSSSEVSENIIHLRNLDIRNAERAAEELYDLIVTIMGSG